MTDPMLATLSSRRRFLTVGGFSVATAAFLAACGAAAPKTRVAQAGETPVTSALAEHVLSDTTLLRTAASLEQSLISAYDKAIGMKQLGGDAASFAAVFLARHKAAKALFDAEVSRLGGAAVTEPNAAFAKNVMTPSFAAIDVAGDKAGDLRSLLHALENVATETYQGFVPMLSTPALRGTVMSVGGAGARHSALWASIMGGSIAASLDAPVEPTTTVKGAVETVTVPVYQSPSAFGLMGLVPALLNGKRVDIDVLGPNSYAY